jgi:hypothetical protein
MRGIVCDAADGTGDYVCFLSGGLSCGLLVYLYI